MNMNIYTDIVKNKQYSQPIPSELLKHSQEYRVLATLRYLFPQKYNEMALGESPDLQDCGNGIGIEVTVAIRENDIIEAKSPVFPILKQTKCRSSKEVNGSPTLFSAS